MREGYGNYATAGADIYRADSTVPCLIHVWMLCKPAHRPFHEQFGFRARHERRGGNGKRQPEKLFFPQQVRDGRSACPRCEERFVGADCCGAGIFRQARVERGARQPRRLCKQ